MLQGFVLTIIGVALGIILGTIVLMAMMVNKKVIKWYMKYVNRITEQMVDVIYEDEAHI